MYSKRHNLGGNMKNKLWIRQCSCLDSLPRYLVVFLVSPSKNEVNDSSEWLSLPQLEFLKLFFFSLKKSLLNSYFSYQVCHSPLSHSGHIVLGDQKRLCFTTLSIAPTVLTARLSVVKQSFFGLSGQYGHRVTKANYRYSLYLSPEAYPPVHCLVIFTVEFCSNKTRPKLKCSSFHVEWGW